MGAMEVVCDGCTDLAVALCEECQEWLCDLHAHVHMCPEMEADSMPRAFTPDDREQATYRLDGLVRAVRLDVPIGFGKQSHTPTDLWNALGVAIVAGA
jgi:hypothetical protein